MAKISVCIITFNEEKFVGQCIEAVKGFADEIIVVDSHSFDKTVQIAKKLGAKVFRKKFSDFAAQRNFALTKAKNEWIFFPDPDEICPKELAQEIVETVNSKNSADGYWIPYKNHYGKKELKYGGESYYHMRLFRRKNAKKKLREKNLDFIVANSINGFGSNQNKVTIIDKKGNLYDIPQMSKDGVAEIILDKIVK